MALRLARPRLAIRALQALVLFAALAFVTVGVLEMRPSTAQRVRAEPVSVEGAERGAAALAFAAHAADVRTEVSRDAALSFGRTLFTSSPGGIIAAAARVSRL